MPIINVRQTLIRRPLPFSLAASLCVAHCSGSCVVPIRAVIFDADGVAILTRRFSDGLERDYGLQRKDTWDFFGGPFEACLVGRADLATELAPSWRGGTGRTPLMRSSSAGSRPRMRRIRRC
jgi:hypothetical protein